MNKLSYHRTRHTVQQEKGRATFLSPWRELGELHRKLYRFLRLGRTPAD